MVEYLVDMPSPLCRRLVERHAPLDCELLHCFARDFPLARLRINDESVRGIGLKPANEDSRDPFLSLPPPWGCSNRSCRQRSKAGGTHEGWEADLIAALDPMDLLPDVVYILQGGFLSQTAPSRQIAVRL